MLLIPQNPDDPSPLPQIETLIPEIYFERIVLCYKMSVIFTGSTIDQGGEGAKPPRVFDQPLVKTLTELKSCVRN